MSFIENAVPVAEVAKVTKTTAAAVKAEALALALFVGVDWAGSPSASGSKYPYRWGLGQDLEPGAEATVTGRIKIEHGPNLDRMVGPPQNRIFLYGGLIHEGIAFQDDKVGGTWIEVGY